MAVALLAILILAAYWAPTIIAAARGKANAGGVIVVNLLLGWSGIGWIVALAMALSGPTVSGQRRRIPADWQPATTEDAATYYAHHKIGDRY